MFNMVLIFVEYLFDKKDRSCSRKKCPEKRSGKLIDRKKKAGAE
jgi:hypothetical protein